MGDAGMPHARPEPWCSSCVVARVHLVRAANPSCHRGARGHPVLRRLRVRRRRLMLAIAAHLDRCARVLASELRSPALAEGSCPTLRRRARIPFVALISYAQRLRDHAAADPDHLAITDEHRTVTRARARAAREPHRPRAAGAGRAGRRPRHDRACRTRSSSSRPRSRAGSSARRRSPSRRGSRDGSSTRSSSSPQPRVVVREPLAVDGFDDAPLPDAISNPWKAMTSGGSTGRPEAHRGEPAGNDRSRRAAVAADDGSTART